MLDFNFTKYTTNSFKFDQLILFVCNIKIHENNLILVYNADLKQVLPLDYLYINYYYKTYLLKLCL